MNFTQSVMIMNATDKNLVFACATDENLEWFEKISYWTEGVFQLGLGNNQWHSNFLMCHFQCCHTRNLGSIPYRL